MSSAYENTMSDVQTNNSTQIYPPHLTKKQMDSSNYKQQKNRRKWTEYTDNDADVYYKTECGEEILLYEGSLQGTRYLYCTFCGKEIKR